MTPRKNYKIMVTKRFNEQSFKFEVNGKLYFFDCYTTHTWSGFCHRCRCWELSDKLGLISYYNRTWEKFDYESILIQHVNRYAPKGVKTALLEQIENYGREKCEAAERFCAAFSQNFSALSEGAKAKTAAAVEAAGGVENINVDALGAVVAFGALLGA